MREQLAAARRLPFEPVPKPVDIDRDQHQPILTGAMPARALDNLVLGREMDKAVGRILRRAAIRTGSKRRGPGIEWAHVVDQLGHGDSLPDSLKRRNRASPRLGA